MVRPVLIAALLALATTACGVAPPGACAVACGPEDSCPSGTTCGPDGICYGADETPGSCQGLLRPDAAVDGDPDGSTIDGDPDAALGDPDAGPGDPDAMLPDECAAPCEILDQCGCPGVQGCYMSEEGDPYCDDPGAGTSDDACDHDDDCAVGFDCMDVFTGSEHCQRYCDADNDCGGGLSRCNRQVDGGAARVCTSDCDPVDPDSCSGTDACVLSRAPGGRYDATCTDVGSGGQGDSCFAPDDCAAGLACIDEQLGGRCEYLCHPGPDDECIVGETCTALIPAAVINGTTFAYCKVN